ncbi:MAG TPA: HDIG domain-containing protein [Gemmatimonadaceae bacterium]|nr:HDIG domain-containing protein [Gemmatimonadaceae bacterium]
MTVPDRPGRVSGEGAGQRSAPRRHRPRLALAAALTLLTYALFPAVPAANVPVYDTGAVAGENVIAPFAFRVLKSDAELSREREAMARTVEPVYVAVPAALDSTRRAIAGFAAALDAAYGSSRGDTLPVQRAALAFQVLLSGADVRYLADAGGRARLLEAITEAYRRWGSAGVAARGALDGVSGEITLRRGAHEESMPADSVRTYPEFAAQARMLEASARANVRSLFDRLLAAFFRATVVPDGATTAARREQLRASVPVARFEVRAGEKIVGANEVVRSDQHDKLAALHDAMEQRRGAVPGIRRAVGALLFDALLIVLLGLTVLIFRPHVYDSMRSLAVIAGVTALVLIGGAVVSRVQPLRPELLPVGIAAIVVAALFDQRIAMIVAVLLAALLGGQAVFRGTNALYVNVIGGAAAAYSVRAVRSRQQTYTWILAIAVAYLAAAAAVGLTLDLPTGAILRSAGYGTINAVASVLIALLVLPLAERYTGVETDLTLLEWSDLNRPLMQRLSLEAPGTFAHSMQIANLAEAGSRVVGANALLARVGAYYHDIGKLANPTFFVENQAKGANPHDGLTPLQSAQIIRNHVREGLQLAEAAGVPRVLRTFIAEHHGTGTITYFLERARAGDRRMPELGDYRYPGPIPQTAETAIVMLADGTEASVRVLSDPTPDRIREVVEHIVKLRLDQGQLRDAPLTLRQLELVKEEFTRVLSGMHHARIEYPASGGGVSAGFAAP